MRLRATYLFALLALSAATACDKTEEATPVPAAVDKTVVFEVFGGQDFSYSQYGEEPASFRLIIERKDKVSEQEPVVAFDTTFTMPLKDLPVRANRMVIKKAVPAVVDEKESVFISSGYTYRQNSFGKNETFPAGQVEKKVQLTVY